jgi:hypothetical protein
MISEVVYGALFQVACIDCPTAQTGSIVWKTADVAGPNEQVCNHSLATDVSTVCTKSLVSSSSMARLICDR